MDIHDLKKQASEYYGLNDDEANAFVEGFLKEAQVGISTNSAAGKPTPKFPKVDRPRHELSGLYDGATSGLGQAIGKGVGAMALNGLVSGVANLVSSAHNAGQYRQFTEALKRVIETNRIVKNADREKVLSYAETIFKFGPHVAADANVLSTILAGCVHGEGVDANTIEMIGRMEERYKGRGGFQPKTFTGL